MIHTCTHDWNPLRKWQEQLYAITCDCANNTVAYICVSVRDFVTSNIQCEHVIDICIRGPCCRPPVWDRAWPRDQCSLGPRHLGPSRDLVWCFQPLRAHGRDGRDGRNRRYRYRHANQDTRKEKWTQTALQISHLWLIHLFWFIHWLSCKNLFISSCANSRMDEPMKSSCNPQS